jgi:hypothetical protein
MLLPHILNLIRLGGHVSASVVLLPMPQKHVQDILPNKLSLASQQFTPAGTHPVFFIFQELKVHWFKDYYQFALEIPYVRKGDDPRIYCYPARFYLNRLPSTLAGLLGYGFPERWAKVAMNETSYEVQSLRDIRLIAGQFEPVRESGSISQFPNFQRGIAQMLNQAYVTKYPPLRRLPGIFFCSAFRYNLSDWQLHADSSNSFSSGQGKQAQIQALNANIQIFRQFAQEFFPGLEGSYTVTNINESPLGAFRLWADWSLSPC